MKREWLDYSIIVKMEFYVTVDSQHCSSFNRNLATLSIILPRSLEFVGQWEVALCEYGLNNGILSVEGPLMNHAYLMTRLVSPQIIGNKMHRILAMIPLDFVPEIADMGFFFREIESRQYIPIDSTSENSIILELKDSKFRPLSFRSNVELMFRLHFKQVKAGILSLSVM